MPTSRVRFSPKTQQKGCVFSHQNARERVYILSKNATERVCFVERVYYSTTILKIFGATSQFSAALFKKGTFWPNLQGKQHVFYQKNCNRKGVFFPKIATERVKFRRPCWHTRIQKLGKSPPPGVEAFTSEVKCRR